MRELIRICTKRKSSIYFVLKFFYEIINQFCRIVFSGKELSALNRAVFLIGYIFQSCCRAFWQLVKVVLCLVRRQYPYKRKREIRKEIIRKNPLTSLSIIISEFFSCSALLLSSGTFSSALKLNSSGFIFSLVWLQFLVAVSDFPLNRAWFYLLPDPV